MPRRVPIMAHAPRVASNCRSGWQVSPAPIPGTSGSSRSALTSPPVPLSAERPHVEGCLWRRGGENTKETGAEGPGLLHDYHAPLGLKHAEGKVRSRPERF